MRGSSAANVLKFYGEPAKFTCCRLPVDLNIPDVSRKITPDFFQKIFEVIFFQLSHNFNSSIAQVFHPAGNPKTFGKVLHSISKPHSLHFARIINMSLFNHIINEHLKSNLVALRLNSVRPSLVCRKMVGASGFVPKSKSLLSFILFS